MYKVLFFKLRPHLCKVCIVCECSNNSGLIHILKKRMSSRSYRVDCQWLANLFLDKMWYCSPKRIHGSDSQVTLIRTQQLELVRKSFWNVTLYCRITFEVAIIINPIFFSFACSYHQLLE